MRNDSCPIAVMPKLGESQMNADNFVAQADDVLEPRRRRVANGFRERSCRRGDVNASHTHKWVVFIRH
jgi:hypothetical protein